MAAHGHEVRIRTEVRCILLIEQQDIVFGAKFEKD
jgi:hypothetical protein